MPTALIAALLTLTQTKTVTVTSHLAHSSVVLEELGRAAGVKMVPTGSVLKDYFFVHFTDTPLETAMARVAKTLNATWRKQEDGSYLLMRTQTQELQTGKDVKSLRDTIARGLNQQVLPDLESVNLKAKIAEAVKLVESSEQNRYQSYEKFDVWAAENRLLIRVMKAIGPDALAQIAEGDTAWFAQAPTRRQYSLPAIAPTLFEQFLKERALVEGLLPASGTKQPTYRLALLDRNQLDLAKPIRVAVSVMRQSTRVFGRLYLEQGGRQVDAGANIMEREVTGRLVGLPGPFSSLKEAAVLTPEQEVLAKGARSLYAVVRPRWTSQGAESWAALVIGKDGRDFTTTLASNLLEQTAIAKGSDMVALVPDVVCLTPIILRASTDKPATLAETWAMVAQMRGGYSVREEDGYVSCRPVDWVAGRDRISRAAMAKGIAKMQTSGIDLDTLAELVAGTDTDETVQALMIFVALASPRPPSVSVYMAMQSPDVLRLYGRLTPAERLKAQNGGIVIGLASPPQSMTRPLDRLLFSRDPWLTDNLPPREEWRHNVTFGERNLDHCTTFCLGDGLPEKSTMKIEVRTDDHLYMRRHNGIGVHDDVTTVEDAANAIAYESSPSFQALPKGSDSAVMGFYVVPQTDLTIVFDFPGEGQQVALISVPSMPTDPQVVSVDQLPAAWKDQLKPKIAKLKELFKQLPLPERKTPPPTLMQ